MILTCPDCATSYNVDAAKIPAEGRTVKCATCGNRWTAYVTPEPLEAEERPAEIAAATDAEVGASDVTPPSTDLTAGDLPKEFRAKAADGLKVREAATTGIVWAAMAAALVVMIAIAGVFRISVVSLWPKSAAAYAWVGLPVNSLGLTIEGVRADPALQEGHAALSVSGMFRNVKDRSVNAPPLRITLLNKSGRVLATKIAQPSDGLVPPGETRHFAIAILDPPITASQLEVAFAPEAAHKGQKLPKAGAPVPSHPSEHMVLRKNAEPPLPILAPIPLPSAADRAAVPAEAEPLPASSPYALQPHG